MSNPILPMPSAIRGSLLVATPPLTDSNFDRTVIYMLDHNNEGAIGVVLNRPLDLAIPDSLHQWIPHLDAPATLFGGGPVDESALIALAALDRPADEAWSPIGNGLGSIDLMLEPEQVAAEIRSLRIFHGYSGWGAQQLDDELAAGAWIVLEMQPNDVFARQPGNLWRDVLRRQGGRLAWLANAPEDLSAN